MATIAINKLNRLAKKIEQLSLELAMEDKYDIKRDDLHDLTMARLSILEVSSYLNIVEHKISRMPIK